LAVSCWLLAVGCWLLAVGYWLLAVGFLSANNYIQSLCNSQINKGQNIPGYFDPCFNFQN